MVEVRTYIRKSRNKKEMSMNNRRAALIKWAKQTMTLKEAIIYADKKIAESLKAKEVSP